MAHPKIERGGDPRRRGGGSSPQDVDEVLSTAFAHFDPVALGAAVGLVSGATLFFATANLLLRGGHPLGPNLALLGNYLPGFEVSWPGAALGSLEVAVGGFAGGWLLARVINFVTDLAEQSVLREVALEGVATPTAHGEAQVSVVVPVGGDAVGFDRCLGSLQRLDPPPVEVVVVLDGADPVRRRQVEVLCPQARIVTLPESRGPAAARNAGARVASGELLLFVDADVEPASNAVARVDALFRERPELAALIGSYDDAPADVTFLSQYRNLLHHFVHQQSRQEASTFWGACGAIRKAVFEEIGGFDESFIEPSIEDIELGFRLRNEGHRIALVRSLQVKHLKRWTVRNMLSTDLLRRAVPWTELMLRDGRLLDDLNVKVKDRWSVVAACVMAASAIASWWWRPAVFAGLAAALALLTANAGLYGFFLRRRGGLFAIIAVLWHWVYLLVCGLGFAIGWSRHLARRER